MGSIKKLLFITWDGPQTSYMEGLFMPIFHEVMKQDPTIEFHVLQFTWAGEEKIQQVKKAAEDMGIVYNAVPIIKKPVAAVGSMLSLMMGSKNIARYIQKNGIDIVMPRSTFPAFMVQRIRQKNLQVIFDADGLPIEERVDFAGLKKGGWQYNWLKSIERKILLQADAVITRSQKAIDVHVESIDEQYRHKFSVVLNGRNSQHFIPDIAEREIARKELNVGDELLWIYAGSLGPQYCWEEMLQVFELSLKIGAAKFLVLTGNVQFAEDRIPDHLKDGMIVKSVAFERIPFYLKAADAAFALRRPTYSMQGVAPIKLGEYLLMGLPTIASSGIGDTEEILKSFPECFIFNHGMEQEMQQVAITDWMSRAAQVSKQQIRDKALEFFSIEKAAESYIEVIEGIK
ncbi:glycosyltransferase family 4 protein [Sphingobacterium sp. SGG-5]|uniref:glycosyltransferase family 4 protein n=1 Tax=Sphingobacterium sp. SGG-5 TaxID=2710881 RepID=UPI0013ECA926|nr:glycosyltransferase family 4 protein [Sphingobacterium sp. SGG-5]NGM63420.1 glycosyltransferase family 4 protein [Sphingobacterium sp. SGG-5]